MSVAPRLGNPAVSTYISGNCDAGGSRATLRNPTAGLLSEQPAQDCTDYAPLEGRAPLSVLNPQHLIETCTKQVLRRDSWMNE